METVPCLFAKDVVMLIRYVDDLFVLGKQRKAIEHVKESLSAQFCLKDMGKQNQILEMKLRWKSGESFLIS